jgi:extracellular factor (EF) 3-hydroxypalmitic acid methyl ester biosynthesis protein
MDTKLATINAGERDSFIVCRNSQGIEVRASLLRLTRFLVIFEVYNPYSILQLSEVLTEFRIVMNDRLVYSGRAVVSNLVNTGIVLVCEATLDESWLDVDLFASQNRFNSLQREFTEFLKEWDRIHRVGPDFKVVVADMQVMLMDLRRWLEQVELGIRSEPAGDRLSMERDAIGQLQTPILPLVASWFDRFDEVAEKVDQELRPMHRSYAKRQLHPLVLCSPFVYRTFQKPLGYAGDYEMVNMILRDPLEGGSLFAKIVNVCFLKQPPAEAHRNRITYLLRKLADETSRASRRGRPARIFNLGCGPAGEIQQFLKQDDASDSANFTLLDFNDETLAHTTRILDDLKLRFRRATSIQTVKRSVHQILKEASRPGADTTPQSYDFVYCAGLFDYMSDRICKRLMNFFYDLLAPGGLLVATNVDCSRPFRNSMEFILEWHLIYRNRRQIETLLPDAAPPGAGQVSADKTGVNVFIEVRKPDLH